MLKFAITLVVAFTLAAAPQAVKKTEEAVEKAAKKTVAVTKTVAKDTAEGTKKVVKKTGDVTETAAKDTAAGTKKVAQKTGQVTETAADKTVDATKAAGKTTAYVAKTVGKETADATKTGAKKVVGALTPGGPKVNLNTASRAELIALPGIGEANADKIIKARPIASVEDLSSKKIIQAQYYEKVKGLVTVK